MKTSILWTFISPLWLATILLAALLYRNGLDGLAILGLTSLFPLNERSAYLWLSILAVAGFSTMVFGFLWGIRWIVPPLRRFHPLDFLLAGWVPGAGLVLSLWRVVFAYGDADWIARLEPLIVAVGTVFVLTGGGAAIQRLIGGWPSVSPPPQPSPARGEGVALCAYLIQTNLLGAAGLSILLYLLALAGLWHPSVLWGIVGATVVLGVPLIWRDLTTFEREPVEQHWSTSNILLTAALLLVLTASSLLASLPPDDSDELRYHLTIPKRYLEHGGWVDIEGQHFAHFPLGMEMLFALPLSLDWVRPPEERYSLAGGGKIIHFWFFLLCLMTIHQWGRERLVRDLSGSEISPGGVQPPWRLWFLVTVSFAPVLASWAFVDFGSAFGWLASVYFVWKHLISSSSDEVRPNGWGGNREPWIFYASLAAGWAMMVKYTGLAWWVILGVIGGTFLGMAQRLRWKGVLGYALIPPLLISPWLIQNLLTTGNPFSPLLSGVFGDGFTPVQKAFYDWHAGMKGGMNEFANLSLPGKILDILFLPFRATLFPEQFEHNPLGGLLLCGLPFGLLGGIHIRRDTSPRGVGLIAASALGVYLLWAFTYRDPRFAIPLWAILAMGIGLGLEKELLVLKQAYPRVAGRWGLGVTVVVMVWGLGQCDEAFLRCLRFSDAILLKAPPDDYLKRPARLPEVATIREVEFFRTKQGIPRPALLLLGQEQSYFFDSPVRGNDYFDGPELAPLARDATSVEAISSHILKMGYQWIWVNRGTLEGNVFNLVRGDLFTSDPDTALLELRRIRESSTGGLSGGVLDDWRKTVSGNAAFRRMHAWLVRHPGFREVPLTTVHEEVRPICPYYGDWMQWEEMKGVSVKDLPRKRISLLIAE